MSDTLLPCENCGAELFGNTDAEEVRTTVPVDFEFAGQQAGREVPGLRCPECGEVTAL